MLHPIARRTVAALMTATAAVLAIIYAPASWLPPAFAVIAALAIIEFFGLLRRRLELATVKGFAAFLVGALFLVSALSVLPAVAVRDGNLMMLYFIAIIKVSDMGGFAFGVSFGRHKLCPSISPNKSWEGLAGSVLASVIVSLAFTPITNFIWWKAVLFGIVAALVGTAGDLVESKFKRWVGVKDSSTFMPAGMGGILDMFDSLLLAPAVLMVLK